MTVSFNDSFRRLLEEYALPDDLSFDTAVPSEVQDILREEIIITELGVTLQTEKLHKAVLKWENQSIIEDDENHFHVDAYVNPTDSKQAFMLGVKTLQLLAHKFEQAKLQNVRCWYSFEVSTYISDRLSFHTLRDGEEIISLHQYESAVLIIDI